MRVITGSARGRKLKEPQGSDIRPTTDQVKEAIFNICQFDVEGRRVLDLFGGTGQLGIEAKSRGAKQVDIVDASRRTRSRSCKAAGPTISSSSTRPTTAISSKKPSRRSKHLTSSQTVV